ncbi:MAG: hypothetical protein KME45_25355 [Stenomitos rutilans HA7619-LM2]|jgi:hypothetical protein|nr:hypothetical protein [Stenomitos rutilans HA7619-LM2]
MRPLELTQVDAPLVSALVSPVIRRWRLLPTGLAVMVGLAASGLITQTIAPPTVHAYTGTVNVTIDVQPSETYDTLVRRAEAIARAATQRSFDRDILVTDVSIMVIAQSASSTVPVLSLTTTRPQWRSQPDPRRWATYYSTSKALLRLNSSPSATTAQPTVTTSTPQQPQPRSTAPSIPTQPSAPVAPANGGASTGTTQPPTATPSPTLPQRIPTPGNIGK